MHVTWYPICCMCGWPSYLLAALMWLDIAEWKASSITPSLTPLSSPALCHVFRQWFSFDWRWGNTAHCCSQIVRYCEGALGPAAQVQVWCGVLEHEGEGGIGISPSFPIILHAQCHSLCFYLACHWCCLWQIYRRYDPTTSPPYCPAVWWQMD